MSNDVLINLTVHARGEMATKLLEAAEELGLPVSVVKTTSEGFRVPLKVHRYLFPSAYDADGEPDVPELSNDELAKVPGVEGFDVEDLTEDEPDDLDELTEDELDDLTDPAKD